MKTLSPTPEIAKLSNARYAVPSASTPGTLHVVAKVAGGLSCDCNGFVWRGKCRHVAAVADRLNAERVAGKPDHAELVKTAMSIFMTKPGR